MNKQQKTLLIAFGLFFLFCLTFGALVVAADRIQGGSALIAALIGFSLLAAALICHLICRWFRSCRKSLRMLSPRMEEQLKELPPWEQFETLVQLHAQKCEEFDFISVERFLSRLLSDNSHTHVIENLSEQLRSILHSESFGYRWTYFCVVYIQLEDYESYILNDCNNHLFLADFRRMYDVVVHAFSQAFSPLHLAHNVEIEDSCVFLVNLAGSSPSSPRETLDAQVDSICGACLGTIRRLSEAFNLTVQATVSNPFCDIMETHSTFAWLQTLREYVDFMHGTFPVLGPQDYNKFMVTPHIASPMLESTYYSALLADDYIQAEQTLYQLGDYVLERDAFSISNLKLVMLQCLSAAEEIALSTRTFTDSSASDWRGQLQACENYNQLTTIIHSFFVGLTSRASTTEREGANTAQRIAAYLDEHYCCPNLSVVTLADEFSLSQSYISRIFKRQTGLSIPDYIHEKRVRKAKHLLLHTALAVSEISSQVGYSTPWTLNRIFKRQVKMTPGAFRQLAQQEVHSS